MEQYCENAAAGRTPESDETQRIESANLLPAFYQRLDQAFLLPDVQQADIRNDFVRGVDTLQALGMPLSEIIQRLNPHRLGGFYTQAQDVFYPLDNGSKQYPLAMLDGNMAMFRLSAMLDAPVDSLLLQLALTFTLRRFPHYATRLRRGAFWYYLMPYIGRYAVMPESGTICRPFNISDENEPLFRVQYSGCRVSAEFLHILTDGMGGMVFLKSLLAEYYRLQGEEGEQEDIQVLDASAPSQLEDVENGFIRFCKQGQGEKLLGSPAVQLTAKRLPAGVCRIDQYLLSAEMLQKAAHAYGVSVTTLMSAVILDACRRTEKAKSGRYKLQVPVDLRRIFPSRTLRNFSWYGVLCADAGSPLNGAELAADLQKQLGEMTAHDTLERNVSAAQRMIRWLKYVPLQWKALLMRTLYRAAGDYFFSTTLSNLGVIALHGPLEAHVREIAAILGPSPGNPYNFALSTVHDWAVLSVTRATKDVTMLHRLEESMHIFGLTMIRKGTI